MILKERFKLPAYVCVILRKDDRILLVERTNTGYFDNHWGIPGGFLEHNESLLEGAVREIHEEANAQVELENLTLVHVSQFNTEHNKLLGFYFEAKIWKGELKNNEPHKHGQIAWFDLNNLPANLTPGRHALAGYKNNTNITIIKV